MLPPKKTKNFNQRVYDIVRQIPFGHVLSYGNVAHLAGNYRASRAVGYALAACPGDVPAHRVLFKDGTLSRAFIVNGKNRQYTLLRKESVTFTKEKKVKMARHTWPARELEEQAFINYGM
ncbi:methylated-DNA-protein-cysteine methyltransferase-like protein [Elusimicrobium simillimum]|uniref:MGMT family protein n=1 Tax=Elusimicrobium simillimum TaxID=3143438 RepID=UPI003C6F0C59